MGLFRLPSRLVAFAAVWLCCPQLNASTTASQMLRYQDVFNIEYAGAPFFSQDGKTLYYVRHSMDIMQDKSTSSVWQIDLSSDEQRPLLADNGNITQPVLSPDGSKLAYISDISGQPQVYLHYLDNGLTTPLTRLQQKPSHLSWSPDGKQLAFTLFTPVTTAPLFSQMPDKPDGAKWAEQAHFIERTEYRADGAGYLPTGFAQIYVLPVTGGTPRQLTFGAYPIDSQLSYSADGQWLYYATDPTEDYALHPLRSDLYRVNVATATTEQVTRMAGPEGSPKVSPDGQYLAFTQLNDQRMSYQNSDLVVLNLTTNKLTRLTTKLDRSLGDFMWDTDSRSLVLGYLDKGHQRLARVSINGKLSKLDVDVGGQSLGRPYTSGEFTLSNRGDIAYTLASAQRPADLALHDSNGKQRTLTQLNEDALGHLKLADTVALNVTSSTDGRAIDAWIAYPPGFDAAATGQRFPLILEIHGGPHAAYGPHFALEIQLMAAQGYIVVWANPRGSASYGAKFGNLIHHNYPSADYQDLMDVVDASVATGHVDEQNLFITGGSGGGVLTAWAIGKTDRFAAAVVAKPVINWLSFALTADAYPYFSQYWMPGKPWEVADHLWQHSPLSLVGNVTTPTLLLTGEADYRTPISESEQFYQALQLQGVASAMLRIPGASHGIAARPSRLIQKTGNILAWFERYKNPGKAKAKPRQ